MTVDREKKYADELAKCRKSIERSKRLIEYHKKMLKTLENKEKALSDKPGKEKFSGFYELVCKKGYDIDELRNAADKGNFDEIFPKAQETTSAENIKNMKEIKKDENA